MKKAVIALAAIPFVLIGLWWAAVPEALIIRHMEDALGRQGMKIHIRGFSKGLLYNFSIGQLLVLTSKDFPIVSVNDFKAGIDFLSLFEFKPQLAISGIVSDGRVYGVIDLRGIGKRLSRTITASGEGININGIPAIGRFEVRGNGNLGFDLNLLQEKAEVRFSIREMRLKGVLPGVEFFPLDIFQSVRGALTIDKTITIKSLTLEGRGVYARANGKIAMGNRLDMKIELMRDSSYALEPIYAKILEPYMVSPGFYIILFSHIFPAAG